MNAFEYKAMTDADRRGMRENAMRTAMGIAGGCEGCGACCGRVFPTSRRERATMLDYVRRHGVRPVATREQMCALLDPATHRCMAYGARPLVCRVWDSPANAEVTGTRRGQPCGMRVDMARLVMKSLMEMEETDTWEMFGVSLDEEVA